MQGEKKIIEALNTVLKNALMAINQYFLHARMFRNWGLERLNDYQYRQSIRVMMPSPITSPVDAMWSWRSGSGPHG